MACSLLWNESYTTGYQKEKKRKSKNNNIRDREIQIKRKHQNNSTVNTVNTFTYFDTILRVDLWEIVQHGKKIVTLCLTETKHVNKYMYVDTT